MTQSSKNRAAPAKQPSIKKPLVIPAEWGWEDCTAEALGKTLTIVGAPRPRPKPETSGD